MTSGIPNQSKDPDQARIAALERRLLSLEAALRQVPSRFPARAAGVSTSIRETISQPGHLFIAGDVVRRSSTEWVWARADVVADARYSGVIESVTTNAFVLVYAGLITLEDATLSPGETYYLSDVDDGGISLRATITAGELLVPVMRAVDETTAIVMSGRDIGSDLETLTAGSFTGGGGKLLVNLNADAFLQVDSNGVHFQATADRSVAIDMDGVLVITYENGNTVTVDPADFVGTNRDVRLRELDICDPTDYSAKKVLGFFSELYT